jgi:HEAT repeat protein
MKRRWLLLSGIVLALAAGAVLLVPEMRFALLGGIRGERFYQGRPTSHWVHILHKGKDEERANAAEALGEIGPAADVVPALIAALEDENEFVIRRAADSLGKFGPDAVSAVPALVRALKDKDNRFRLEVARVLGDFGEGGAKEAVPALIETVRKDSNATTKMFAIASLRNLGAEAHVAIPVLVEALKDPGGIYGSPGDEAQRTLVAFGPVAVPALLEALRHPNARIRATAASVLGGHRAEARKIVPAVAPLLKDPDRAVRFRAAWALWTLDRQTGDTLPIFLESLNA